MIPVSSLRRAVGLLTVMMWVTAMIGGSGVLIVWAITAAVTFLWVALWLIQLIIKLVAWRRRTSRH